MFRATTPQHSFLFDVNPDAEFKTILITYAQKNGIVLEKEKGDLAFSTTIDDTGQIIYVASFRMTQEETKRFDATSSVKVQLRVVTNDGEVIASDKMTVTVKDVLDDKELA